MEEDQATPEETVAPAPEPEPLLGDVPASPATTSDGKGAFPKIAVAGLVFTLLYGILLALLAGDGRGGLGRLVGDAPLQSGSWLLLGYSVALAITVLLGWWALAKGRPVSLSTLPALLLLGAGGVLSAMASQRGTAAVLAADTAARAQLVQVTIARVAFPKTIALLGASMLLGLSALVGVARLYRGELPVTKRWGPFAALVLAVLLGASVPLSWSGMSASVSPLSLLPLVATHYVGLAVLAFALPRALRMRAATEPDRVVPLVRALGLACLASPLAVLLAWQASSAAAESAPQRAAGRPLAEALVILGPQSFLVTLAAAALVALSAGGLLRRAFTPRAAPIVGTIVGAACAAAYVWAEIARSGIRPPRP